MSKSSSSKIPVGIGIGTRNGNLEFGIASCNSYLRIQSGNSKLCIGNRELGYSAIWVRYTRIARLSIVNCAIGLSLSYYKVAVPYVYRELEIRNKESG